MAFLILAHQDLTQLRRLCCALGPDDDIYVHVDRKTPLDARTIGTFQPNVTFVMPRVTAHWAHISILEATVRLIDAALGSGHDYLRLVLLSGACYPIRPIEALRQRFLLDPSRNDIRFGPVDDESRRWKLSRFHFRAPVLPGWQRSRAMALVDRAVRKGAALALRPIDRGFERRHPDLVPYFGSQFWAMTPGCARLVIGSLAASPALLAYYGYSWAPDEHLIHTIVGNSALAGTAGAASNGGAKLTNLHYIPERMFVPHSRNHAGSWATLDDLDAIVRSEQFFVRKVCTARSGALLDRLDERLRAH